MTISKEVFLKALERTIHKKEEPCRTCVASVVRETTAHVDVETDDVCYWCYKLINKVWFPRIKWGRNCPCAYLGRDEAIERALKVLYWETYLCQDSIKKKEKIDKKK